MHEGRGLERSICRLSSEMCPRDAAQLIVDERDEPLERRSIATPPIEKEARDLRTALFCHSNCSGGAPPHGYILDEEPARRLVLGVRAERARARGTLGARGVSLT